MQYSVKNLDIIPTPALIYYREAIKHNIALAMEIAGTPAKLRPHVKSHKTVEIPEMQQQAGITKFKTATVAEAEMLAMSGIKDILLAYPMVGINIQRFIGLIKSYPLTLFSTLVDDENVAQQLSKAASEANVQIRLMVDIDAGMHRTGTSFEKADLLYRKLSGLPSLWPVGLHVYDGHNNDKDFEVRLKNAAEIYAKAMKLKTALQKDGIPVETITLGGTPSFPCYARLSAANEDKEVELSPGTCFLQDYGYQSKYTDLPFIPAALLISRVVSNPEGGATLELGYKAVASDPPPSQRVQLKKPIENGLQDIPFKFILQSEEHLGVSIPGYILRPGDIMYIQPTHICPTSALYENVYVADGAGNIIDTWEIKSRRRIITL